MLFKAWKCCPQRTALSKVFKALSFYPSADTIKSSLPTINQFISHVYTDEIVQLNIARFNLCLWCRSLRELPSSEHALYHQAQCFPGRLDLGKHVSPRTCTVCIRLWLEERYLFSACAMDWAPDLDRKILNDFIATCKHPKSALSNVNCSKCGCANKDISCIE